MKAIRTVLLGVTFLGLLVSSNILFAQNEVIRIKSQGSIIDKDSEKKLDGVQVVVFKNVTGTINLEIAAPLHKKH